MNKNPFNSKKLLAVLFIFLMFLYAIYYFNNRDYIQPDFSLNNISRIILPFIFLMGFILLLSGVSKAYEVFIEPYFASRHKCSICGKSGRDILSEGMDKLMRPYTIGYFCRDHLIQRYSAEFKKSPFKMVVMEFQPNATPDTGHVYSYYPLSILGLQTVPLGGFWTIEEKKIIEKLLDTIKNRKCSVCNKEATVLFVSEEAAPWKKYENTPSMDFAEKGEYLCKEHAIDKVLPNIKNDNKYFDDGGGLYPPYQEDGFQATTII